MQPHKDGRFCGHCQHAVDQTGEVLTGASVRIDTLHLSTSTDATGRFEFYLPAEWVDKCPLITASYVGFGSTQVFAEHNGNNEFIPVVIVQVPNVKGALKISRVRILRYRIGRFFGRRY